MTASTTVTVALPSVKSSTRQRSPLCRAPLTKTLGKGGHFAECHRQDTRQTGDLCRVPSPWHSANLWCLPSAMAFALGKACSQIVTLPSVMAIALDKVTENNLFICFLHPIQTNRRYIYNKHHIYIINNTYISPTPHIYHKRHIYITNVTCLTIYHKYILSFGTRTLASSSHHPPSLFNHLQLKRVNQ